MSEYFRIVNLDKKEWLDPLKLGDSLKVTDLIYTQYGAMSALGILLVKSTWAYSGEWPSKIFGAWAGDRIVIIGDYDESKLYEQLETEYKDISLDALRAMATDENAKDILLEDSTLNSALRESLKAIGVLDAD